MNRCLALLTDFGASDWFAASMKGVILSLNPAASIVDITHDIPPGDVQSAAFCLVSCYSCFPQQTIFAVVVDPGVGSKRAAIAIRAGEYFFVGPDNGVLSAVAENFESIEIRSIENPACFRSGVSTTFHGRDIFAPTAARLSLGFPYDDLGPKRPEMVRLIMPVAETKDGKIIGTVLYVDRFGNLITNISPSLITSSNARLQIGNSAIPVCSCYADVAEGKVLAVVGSCGFIEISVNLGNAAKKLGLRVGDQVLIG
jgi:hypothetical protein